MEPTDGPLNNPSINAQTTAMLGITFCQDRFDALLPQHLAMMLGVVGTISLHSARTFAGPTPFAADWRNPLDQGQELRNVASARNAWRWRSGLRPGHRRRRRFGRGKSDSPRSHSALSRTGLAMTAPACAAMNLKRNPQST